MPSVSKKQHNLMAAVASNPAFAKKAGIPQRVGADFMKADKGRKFAKGGDMAKKMPPFMGKETKAEEAKEMKVKAKSPAMYRKGEKAEGVHGKSGMEKPTKYAKGGGCELKGKTKGQQFADGGMPMASPSPFIAPRNKPTPITQFGKGSRPQVGMAPNPIGQPMDMRYRGDNPALTNKSREQQLPEKIRMAEAAARGAQQRGGLSNMSPQAKTKIGDALAKMMGNVRAKGANAMVPKDDTNGFIENERRLNDMYRPAGMKKGGAVKKFAKGGAIDGCATKGKTKGRII